MNQIVKDKKSVKLFIGPKKHKCHCRKRVEKYSGNYNINVSSNNCWLATLPVWSSVHNIHWQGSELIDFATGATHYCVVNYVSIWAACMSSPTNHDHEPLVCSTFSMRIYDLTNNKTICEIDWKPTTSNDSFLETSPQLYSSQEISNVSKTPALWEIHVKTANDAALLNVVGKLLSVFVCVDRNYKK